MGLFEIEDPIGLVAPEVLTLEGTDLMESDQEIDCRRGRPGDRTDSDDTLLPALYAERMVGR